MDIEVLTKGKTLSDNEQKNLTYVVDHLLEIEGRPLKEVAKQMYTSPATLVRLAQKLDFSGYTEFIYYLKNQHHQLALTEAIIDYKLDPSHIDPLIHKMRAIYAQDTGKFIMIYAAGFSSILADYLYKKLLVNGMRAILVSPTDSSGMITNNLSLISMFITISKSGETPKTIEKMNLVAQHQIPCILFTGTGFHTANEIAQIVFEVEDEHPLDTQNISYNSFFGKLMLLLEYIVDKFK